MIFRLDNDVRTKTLFLILKVGKKSTNSIYKEIVKCNYILKIYLGFKRVYPMPIRASKQNIKKLHPYKCPNPEPISNPQTL